MSAGSVCIAGIGAGVALFALVFIPTTIFFIIKLLRRKRTDYTQLQQTPTGDHDDHHHHDGIHISGGEVCFMGWAWGTCRNSHGYLPLSTFIAWYIVQLVVGIALGIGFYFLFAYLLVWSC